MVRLDTRPGVEPWAKAGIIIKSSLTDGSPYAAMMVAADHGVRMQWNYTGDTPGLPGAVGPENPRWLRLTRSGDVITGYDSADGTHWTEVGAVTLSGLPRVVQVGLFAASPVDLQSQYCSGYCNGPGGPTQATGVFDHRERAWPRLDRRVRGSGVRVGGRQLPPGWRRVQRDRIR